MTQVLSVTSECAPLMKTGGLADVAGALPAALAPLGIRMRTLLPGYPAVLAAVTKPKVVSTYDDLFGGAARLLAATAAGLDLLILEAAHLFDRPGNPYLADTGHDWPDNPERFAALSWVAADIAAKGIGARADKWHPDVVHCHDWQAALAPVYMQDAGTEIPSILTVHNIAFHGLAPMDRAKALRLKADDLGPDGYEFWGQISALKAGLMTATRLTTVSKTYARELMTEEFGMGLDGVLRDRAHVLSGIVNGIDTATWDPATDPLIAEPYKTPAGKKPNKATLRREFGLPPAGGPLCIVVSRLTEQKGLDLLLQVLPALVDRGGQLALLGSGDPGLEAAFQDAAAHRNIAVKIGYDEALSHRMMAGADAILVPSRFEPCGLTQLYGLRYGTVPLVTLTGGLADTVIPASPAAMAARAATGLSVNPLTAHALSDALIEMCHVFAQPKLWTLIAKNGMKHPVGWDASATEYAALYDQVTLQT